MYVISLNKEKNAVVVGEEKDIYSDTLYATDLNYLLDKEMDEPIKVKAKIRYSAKEAEAILTMVEHNKVKVQFEKPQRAITSGQSVVFYIDNIVFGGGKII